MTSVNGAGLAATTPFVVTVDKANPAASIAVPTANATISGVQTIRVDAADNSGGSGAAQVEVRFCRGSSGCDFSDGTPVGIDIDAPYEFAWNTSGLTDGAYKLVARALDNVGNRTDTAGIAVTVSNTGMLRQPSNDASNVLSVTLAGVKP